MDTANRPRTALSTLAAAAVAVLTLLLATAGGAAAATPSDGESTVSAAPSADVTPLYTTCLETMCYQINRGPASNDEGGIWAYAKMWQPGRSQDVYSINFIPRGEVLVVVDAQPGDGFGVSVDVTVRNPAGVIVDRDHFWTDKYQRYNLGTPDGSGDIKEGYRVEVKFCWRKHCSVIEGVA